MIFNPINLYKLHLNNANNLDQGNGTGRITLQIPQYFPKHKRCFVYVEYAALQVKKDNNNPQHEWWCINSNLFSPNSYSNNNKNCTGILAYFSKSRKGGLLASDKFLEIQNPTNPTNIGYLPNQIELYIENPIDDVEITLFPDAKYIVTLCCQFVDDD